MLILLMIFINGLFSQTYENKFVRELILNSDIENTNNAVYFVSPDLSSSITMTFPATLGPLNNIFITDGNGSLTFTPVSSTGSPSGINGSVQYNDNSSFGGAANFIWNNSLNRLGIGTATPNYTLQVNGTIKTGSNGTDGSLVFQSDGTSNYFTLTTGTAMVGNVTYRLPVNHGSGSNKGLVTDGAGNLSWAGDIRLGPVTNNSPNNNNITNFPEGAYIGGGSDNDMTNTSDYSVIYGGNNNNITNAAQSVGIIGGTGNDMSNTSDYAVILGGNNNNISNTAISGGIGNGINIDISNSANYAFIAGGNNNNITTPATSAIIFSGLDHDITNTAGRSMIGSGDDNDVLGNYSAMFVGESNDGNNSGHRCINLSGQNNSWGQNTDSFIGSGENNDLISPNSSIIGGQDNTISNTGADYSSILWGYNCNYTNGAQYCFSGGRESSSDNSGDYGLLFGRRAKGSWQNGYCLLADGSDSDLNISASNSWRSRFAGGYRLWTNTAASVGVGMDASANTWSSVSDSNLKAIKINLNYIEVKNKLLNLPIYAWTYKDSEDQSKRNYGPVAQDFYKLFGNDELGKFGSDTTIKELDLSAIFVSGVKGISLEIDEQTNKIKEFEKSLKKDDDKIDALLERAQKLKNKLK